MDKNALGVDECITEWGPACLQRIASIRSKLSPGEIPGHDTILHAIDCVEETYLQPGYQEKLRSLVPRDKIVFCHNDSNENNILSSLEDATKIVLIDYEYGSWNPQFYDLAIYLNEHICQNAYPKGTGIAYYMSNWPSDGEIEHLVRAYYSLLHN